MQYQAIILVDGENLCLRYKGMLESGRVPHENNIYIPECFVWNKNIAGAFGQIDIVRIGYYTTVVGDDDKQTKVKEIISNAEYEFTSLSKIKWHGTLVPYVYKKAKNGSKTKSVDINLTIDTLRYAYGGTIDQIILITGDGDYIPLLREVMARGKMIQVWALSNGLNPEINHHVDDLTFLDDILFKKIGHES